MKRNEYRKKQEEETKLLKRTEVEEELRRAKIKGMLNIQPLAVGLPLHSSSFSNCVEGKAYNKKIQFV